MKLSENIKTLIAFKLAKEFQAPVDLGVLKNKIDFILKTRKASIWVQEAIKSVRNAPGKNPWKHQTADQVAAEILRRIKEREKAPSNSRAARDRKNDLPE